MTPRDIPGPGPQTVGGLLDAALETFPEREAVVTRRERLSYADLESTVTRASHALNALGVTPGTVVAASLVNDIDILAAFLATMRLGAIWAGINWNLALGEKAFMLKDTGAAVFLCSRKVADQIETLRQELPALRSIVVAESGDPSCPWRQMLAAADDVSLRPNVDPHAPAALAYTSGTTGFPKAVVHSQHNILVPGAVITSRGTKVYNRDMRNGVLLPLTILNPMILQPLVTFRVGGCAVLIDRIDPAGLRQWLRQEQITIFMTVPTIMQDLLTDPATTTEDLASVAIAGLGGAQTPPKLRDLYRQWFGREVTSGYGLTEAPTAVTQQNPTNAIAGSAGRALPQYSIQILDENDHPVPTGQSGEICVGPQRNGEWAYVWTPMLGYWNRPDASAKALRGGLLHTGDIGHLDEDGNLFVHDRRSDLILRGGANVYPAEVERVLSALPDVVDCAVYGIPDERLGQRVAASIQLLPGTAKDGDAIRSACRNDLARYKIPEEIIFVDEMPRNAMQKINKAELRRRHLDAMPPATTTS